MHTRFPNRRAKFSRPCRRSMFSSRSCSPARTVLFPRDDGEIESPDKSKGPRVRPVDVRRTHRGDSRCATTKAGLNEFPAGLSYLHRRVVSSLSFTASPVPESIPSHKQSSGDRCTKGLCPGVSFFDQRPSAVLPRSPPSDSDGYLDTIVKPDRNRTSKRRVWSASV